MTTPPDPATTTCAPGLQLGALPLELGLLAGSAGWQVGPAVQAFNGSHYSWSADYVMVGGEGGGVSSGGAVVPSVDTLPLPGLLPYTVTRWARAGHHESWERARLRGHCAAW